MCETKLCGQMPPKKATHFCSNPIHKHYICDKSAYESVVMCGQCKNLMVFFCYSYWIYNVPKDNKNS